MLILLLFVYLYEHIVYIYMNKEAGLLHIDKEACLANLRRSSLCMEQSQAIIRDVGEKARMDFFCTHYQYLHTDQRKALPSL